MPTNHDPDCPVCFGPHHQPTHEASLDVRAWLRDEITRKLGGPSLEPEKPLRLIAPAPASRPLNERTRESKRAPKEPRQRKNGSRGRRRDPMAVSKRSGLSARAILDRLAIGDTMTEIGESFGTSMSAVSRRLSKAMRVNQGMALEYAALCRCPDCGGNKPPSLPNCNACGKRGRPAAFTKVARCVNPALGGTEQLEVRL